MLSVGRVLRIHYPPGVERLYQYFEHFTYQIRNHLTLHHYHLRYSTFVRTALSAEWEPAEGDKWEVKDFAGEIAKLEKEASKRLEDKIDELNGNVESVGKP